MLVYKYRGGNDEIFKRDLDSLEKNYYWSANLESLNDVQENMIFSDKIMKQSNFLSRFFGKKSNDSLLGVHEALNNFLSHNKRIGIYSLSKSFNEETQWAYYANSNTGFCVEYELDKLLNNYVFEKRYSFPVLYTDSPSEVDFRDIASASKNDDLVQKSFGCKSKKWEHEKEYRIITNDFGRQSYDFNAVKAIYFGLKMSISHKEELMERLSGRGIKFYQMKQLERKYGLEGVLINEDESYEIKYLKQIPLEITKSEAIGYEIFEKFYIKDRKKAEIRIALDSIISKDQIKLLSNFFIAHLFQGAEMISVFYYLESKGRDGIAWATSHLRDEKMEIVINDLIELE